MKQEAELFRDFVTSRADSAFEQIVRLHINLVFATALRLIGNRALAEEVTQDVFLALARQAKTLNWEKTLAGWLYQTTLNRARMLLRAELRRSHRENLSFERELLARGGESIWASALPLLDEALVELPEQDRLALFLHFFEQRPFREVGHALGVGEDAARKRLDRVLDQLTQWFQKRGFALPAGTLAAGLAFESTQAATAGLSAQIVAAYSATHLAGAATLLGIIMASTKAKIAAVVILAGLGVSLRYSLRQEPAGPVAENLPVSDPPKAHTLQTAPSGAPQLPTQTAAQSAAPNPPGNLFERINAGDRSVSILPRDQAEAFLAKNRTNAESLVTAYQVTYDTNYLRQAAALYPTDPSVLLRVIGHDLFPEERRNWLDRLKAADPENALGYYFSAKDHLDKKDYPAAFQDFAQAAQKSAIVDYYQDQTLGLEEIYLDAGHSAAEAKALAMVAVELPHLHQLVDTGKAMAALVSEYQDAGDAASAQALIRYGLKMADQLETVPDGGMVLGDMVGLSLERNFTRQLDPNQKYPFLEGTVPERLEKFDQREKSIRANSEVFNQWIVQAPEQEIIVYFDRLKRYGEAAAIEWLKNRAPVK